MSPMIPVGPSSKGTDPGRCHAGGHHRAATAAARRPQPVRQPAPGPWVVVLAAGAGRRFGRAKLLARPGPVSLLRRAATLGQTVAGPRCVVVLGARASRMAAELRGSGVRWIVNRRWAEGLSSSLRAGIAALPRDATAALVVLADQYALQPRDLERLLVAARRQPGVIIASGWGGLRGPPAVLPRSVFPHARRLRGDAGARPLLRDPALPVEVVPILAARLDLDRPGDLAAVRRSARGR